RKTHADAGAEPGVGVYLERTAEGAHAIGDDIEADAAAGDLGDFLRRREAGPGDERHQLTLVLVCRLLVDQAHLLRARQHTRLVDAASVVGDANEHRSAIALRRK